VELRRSADGKFACPYCTKTYSFKHSLKEHIDVHRGRRRLEVIHRRQKSVKFEAFERREIATRILPLARSDARRLGQVDRGQRGAGKYRRRPESRRRPLQVRRKAGGNHFGGPFILLAARKLSGAQASRGGVRYRVGEAGGVLVAPGAVLLQRLKVHKLLAAERAAEVGWHAVVVAATDVGAEAREVREGGAAVPADVRAPAAVHVDVLLQRVLEAVRFRAVRARELPVGRPPQLHCGLVGIPSGGESRQRERAAVVHRRHHRQRPHHLLQAEVQLGWKAREGIPGLRFQQHVLGKGDFGVGCSRSLGAA